MHYIVSLREITVNDGYSHRCPHCAIESGNLCPNLLKLRRFSSILVKERQLQGLINPRLPDTANPLANLWGFTRGAYSPHLQPLTDLMTEANLGSIVHGGENNFKRSLATRATDWCASLGGSWERRERQGMVWKWRQKGCPHQAALNLPAHSFVPKDNYVSYQEHTPKYVAVDTTRQ